LNKRQYQKEKKKQRQRIYFCNATRFCLGSRENRVLTGKHTRWERTCFSDLFWLNDLRIVELLACYQDNRNRFEGRIEK
jgi:hypothetical protein